MKKIRFWIRGDWQDWEILYVRFHSTLWHEYVLIPHCKATPSNCAGAILLARDVTGPSQESLGLMDIGVERNA